MSVGVYFLLPEVSSLGPVQPFYAERVSNYSIDTRNHAQESTNG